MIYIGVNTGTSADAIDGVACRFDRQESSLLDAVSVDIPDHIRSIIMEAVESPTLDIGSIQRLSGMLTDIYIGAVELLMKKMKLTCDQVAAIGLHGQTIHHRPHSEYPYTIQIGNAMKMANRLDIDVVDHFRDSDIAVGGQGAPLIPVFHQYLAETSGKNCAVFLNLGGIANATVYDQGMLQGWDIGPANALIDLWCQRHRRLPFDEGGDWARTGKIVRKLLDSWLSDAYFSLKLPKSTGRDYFSEKWLLESHSSLDDYAPEDVQATLCELTVCAVKRDLEAVVGKKCKDLYLYGKGVENRYLVERLCHHLPSMRIVSTAAIGMDPEWLEGGLFAWLAYRYKNRMCTDLTQVTGAHRPVVLGSCHLASRHATVRVR